LWKILDGEELERLRKRLFERYGITEIPYVIVKSGKRKYRATTKDASKIRIAQLVGIYVLKETPFGLMFSIEGTQLFGPLARKNVFEISSEIIEKWMHGEDLEVNSRNKLERGLVIVRSEDLYLGSGLYDGQRIRNLLPKSRKVVG